jgi:hypothetical protein
LLCWDSRRKESSLTNNLGKTVGRSRFRRENSVRLLDIK